VEEVGEGPQGLGGAEEQVPVVVQRIEEDVQDLLLDIRVQVDEQVAAGDEVELEEGRVAQQIVGAKTIISRREGRTW
jgi:uncharacterized Zn finger protein